MLGQGHAEVVEGGLKGELKGGGGRFLCTLYKQELWGLQGARVSDREQAHLRLRTQCFVVALYAKDESGRPERPCSPCGGCCAPSSAHPGTAAAKL